MLFIRQNISLYYILFLNRKIQAKLLHATVEKERAISKTILLIYLFLLPGINNYADTILPLIANQRNESDAWESSLDFVSFAETASLPSSPASQPHPPLVIPRLKSNQKTDELPGLFFIQIPGGTIQQMIAKIWS